MTATADPAAADAVRAGERPPLVVLDEAAFYAADPRRRTSEEAEYGALWRHAEAGGDDIWRLTLICDTGELVLTKVDPYPSPDHEMRVLRVVESETEADKLLAGWQQHCGEAGSLEWLEDRLSG